MVGFVIQTMDGTDGHESGWPDLLLQSRGTYIGQERLPGAVKNVNSPWRGIVARESPIYKSGSSVRP